MSTIHISIPHVANITHHAAREVAVRCDRLAEQITELQAQYRALRSVAIAHGAL